VIAATQQQKLKTACSQRGWPRVKILPFHNSRRDPPQIIAEILDLCLKPQPKTRIMYRTNLSYRQLQAYLNKLQKTRLLEPHHSKHGYTTTEKGLRFLQKWIEIQQIITEENDSSFIRQPIFEQLVISPTWVWKISSYFLSSVLTPWANYAS
jgi:predicted transcriptional regulator